MFPLDVAFRILLNRLMSVIVIPKIKMGRFFRNTVEIVFFAATKSVAHHLASTNTTYCLSSA